MQLTGDSLSKRQQDLNYKVIDAADKKVSFDEVKAEPETNDVAKLFNIDLASKYKNIDYILEVLKSGDSLHISRALKCVWLYDDEYSSVINTDYLHENIFPLMSLKMKRKMLSTISTYVRNESRVNSFYEYCTALHMPHLASKFLNFTSEAFKLDLILNNIGSVNASVHDYKNFFRYSFKLADAFLSKKPEWTRRDYLYELRYLFPVCNIKYLELLEKYGCHNLEYKSSCRRFGDRTTHTIVTKYKERVMKNTLLYVKVLNIKRFVRHTTTSEAKMYLAALLPNKPEDFWCISSWNNDNFCSIFSYIIDLIPATERYRFIKKIFNEKYPLEPFETTNSFYELRYYNYMTVEEREAWALKNIESISVLCVSDYKWYRFINFDEAFTAIKRYIIINPDSSQTTEILNILVESARNQRELEELFNYYYERHVTKSVSDKECFLNKAIDHHSVKIFEFDDGCWSAFNKLLNSIEVYDPVINSKNIKRRRMTVHSNNYNLIALIYHVIHGKDMPKALKKFANSPMYFPVLTSHLDQLNTEKKEIMYQYLLQLLSNRLNTFECKTHDDYKYEIRQIIKFVLDVIKYYEKPVEDLPEIVTKYMKLDSKTFKSYITDDKILTQGQMLRLLKQDASLVVSKLSYLEYNVDNNGGFKLNRLLRKLRIYFVDDIAKEYLTFFTHLLSEPELQKRKVYIAVYGIIQLADANFKHGFMMKYAPSDAKVDHCEIDTTILYIQEAICRFACNSRPPIPIFIMSKFIKGDYLQYCLPMFNFYLTNLPLPLLYEFVASLLDSPVSIQKHGLRLAFKCFNVDSLKKLVLGAWKKTKNISLRMVIYTYFCDYIQLQNTETQTELFEVLKTFILDLNHDDHDDVMARILDTYIPHHLKAEYVVTVWKSVSKFPDDDVNLVRKDTAVRNLNDNIHLLARDTVIQTYEDDIANQLRVYFIVKKPGDDEKHHVEAATTAALAARGAGRGGPSRWPPDGRAAHKPYNRLL